jgi:hypothetical protein
LAGGLSLRCLQPLAARYLAPHGLGGSKQVHTLAQVKAGEPHSTLRDHTTPAHLAIGEKGL